MSGGKGFYGGGGTDGHKSRRFDNPMRGVEYARPRMGVATVGETIEGEVRWVIQNSKFKIQDCQTTVIDAD
jgi:hypothetical protein